MESLKKLVEELEEECDKHEIEKKLQKIGKALITDYVIKVDDVIVEPLWVEAYYYSEKILKGKELFVDPFVHRNDMQKCFDKLYFHHRTDDQRNGTDICLSLGDYYLSFLLKYTLVNDVVRSQSELSPLIRNKYKESEGVIIEKKNPADIVSYTERIGLSSDKETDEIKKKIKDEYKDLKLSVVRDFDKTFSTNFKFPKKESLVKCYLDNPETALSKTEKAEFCQRTLNYCLKEYKN